MLKSRSVASEQQLKKKGVLGTTFLNSSFDSNNAFTRSHTASHTPAAGHLDNDFDENDYRIESDEPQALVDLSVSLSTL